MQPIPPPMVDDAGEDDATFFRARPGINSRNRLAFDGEPPAALLDDQSAIAFIRVRIARDGDGKPTTIFREIMYGEWGRA